MEKASATMTTLEESYNGGIGFEPVTPKAFPVDKYKPPRSPVACSPFLAPMGIFPLSIILANGDARRGETGKLAKTGPSRIEMSLGNYNGRTCGFPVEYAVIALTPRAATAASRIPRTVLTRISAKNNTKY